jgi:tRNA1(Val) A37 N6-methylase TrmN6
MSPKKTLANEPRKDASGFSTDAFLGGRLLIEQPIKGFRAGLDSVLLAASVPARERQSIFELGMGAGVASLCLLARVGQLQVTGIEIDGRLAELANVNASANGFGQRMRCVTGDVENPPRSLPLQAFDHVMMNPPFLSAEKATAGPDRGKARAIAARTDSTQIWIANGLKLLKPKGSLTIIHRADALGDILEALIPGCGDIEVLPLHPKADLPAIRIVVRARKGRRGPMKILPGLVLHGTDGRFTPIVEAALREGRSLIT